MDDVLDEEGAQSKSNARQTEGTGHLKLFASQGVCSDRLHVFDLMSPSILSCHSTCNSLHASIYSLLAVRYE